MSGIPARATLARWAKEAKISPCRHDPKVYLHHDHLINDARRRLRNKFARDPSLGCFSERWPEFLEKNRELFHPPAEVCTTCNEQDAALKGKKGSIARIIPKGMSLSAVQLNELASMKMTTEGKKQAAKAVRSHFSMLAPAEIALFRARVEGVRKSVQSFK